MPPNVNHIVSKMDMSLDDLIRKSRTDHKGKASSGAKNVGRRPKQEKSQVVVKGPKNTTATPKNAKGKHFQGHVKKPQAVIKNAIAIASTGRQAKLAARRGVPASPQVRGKKKIVATSPPLRNVPQNQQSPAQRRAPKFNNNNNVNANKNKQRNYPKGNKGVPAQFLSPNFKFPPKQSQQKGMKINIVNQQKPKQQEHQQIQQTIRMPGNKNMFAPPPAFVVKSKQKSRKPFVKTNTFAAARPVMPGTSMAKKVVHPPQKISNSFAKTPVKQVNLGVHGGIQKGNGTLNDRFSIILQNRGR